MFQTHGVLLRVCWSLIPRAELVDFMGAGLGSDVYSQSVLQQPGSLLSSVQTCLLSGPPLVPSAYSLMAALPTE